MMTIKIDIKKRSIIVLLIGILAILLWMIFSNKNVGNVSPPKLNIRAEIQRDIHYKEDLKLDIYKPLNPIADKHPVIVFIHGGGL
ncbi:carboxylesterase family protein [Olivibacter sp. XZL3]|uniref:carboxylesterase family protein n=1 Tax=Olivibacter sp. XZL3 TaxID=1735116 RepID=UPI001065DF70|nr:carboxylesterase family protein [Olivibacter sp. XZL3]